MNSSVQRGSQNVVALSHALLPAVRQSVAIHSSLFPAFDTMTPALASILIEDAYSFVRKMIKGHSLEPSPGGKEPQELVSNPGQIAPGSQLLGATVVWKLRAANDTEAWLLSRAEGFSVLKIEDASPQEESARPARARLAHEAAFLAHLNEVPKANIACNRMAGLVGPPNPSTLPEDLTTISGISQIAHCPSLSRGGRACLPKVASAEVNDLAQDGVRGALVPLALDSLGEVSQETNVTPPLLHPTPKLLDKGELDGRFYLEREFIPGVDALTAAAEWREIGAVKGRQMLLHLAQTIARTYATLHERGVLHGNVHPRNVLIRSDSTAVLLDFSHARPSVSQTFLPTPLERGGTSFFFEPEMARVALAGLPSMPVSAPGEQHAVAALIYFLVTGAHWQNFRPGRDAMLEDIATLHPLTFRERGVEPWPEMEAVLGRALSKLPDARFPSMSAFAATLDHVTAPPTTNGF